MPQNKQPGGGLYAWYSLTACGRSHRTAGIIVTVRSAGARSVPYVTVSAGWLAGWVIVGRVGRYITALCFLSCRPLARAVSCWGRDRVRRRVASCPPSEDLLSARAGRMQVDTDTTRMWQAGAPAARDWMLQRGDFADTCHLLGYQASGFGLLHTITLLLVITKMRWSHYIWLKHTVFRLHLSWMDMKRGSWNLDGKEYCRLSVIWNNAYHRI